MQKLFLAEKDFVLPSDDLVLLCCVPTDNREHPLSVSQPRRAHKGHFINYKYLN